MNDSILVYSSNEGYIDSPSLFKKEKKKAKKLYDQLRQSTIICPALENQEVKFTLMGWNHIVANKPHKRKGRDLFRRLKLLPYAKGIIEKSSTIQNSYKRKEKNYIILEAWLKELDSKVRVVLVKTKLNIYTFYSIMDKK